MWVKPIENFCKLASNYTGYLGSQCSPCLSQDELLRAHTHTHTLRPRLTYLTRSQKQNIMLVHLETFPELWTMMN